MELRDDDAFWAARRVAAFTDELIRAAVHTGQFSDPEAEKYLGDVLIKRRDKIASIYLTAVNPIVDPRLEGNRLTFENAAVDRGRGAGPGHLPRLVVLASTTPPARRSRWHQRRGVRRQRSRLRAACRRRPAASSRWTSRPTADAHPAWRQPVRTYFRRDGAGWKLVGLERMPDKPAAATTAPAPAKTKS